MSSTKLSLGLLILAANIAFAAPVYAAPAEESIQAATMETNDEALMEGSDSEDQTADTLKDNIQETEAPTVIYAVEETKAEAAAVEKASEDTADKEDTEEEIDADTGEETEDESEDASENEVSGNAVIEFAKQFLGGRYRYGGTSLTNGTDCSGFTMSVYRNFGISLPHSSSAQRSVGTAVGSLAEAEAGDLICYSGHVALYLGNGQIVHAQNARKGITISNAGYSHILAIRRVL